jgi:hypothetical protein
MPDEPNQQVPEDELEEQEGEVLPERAAMSIIRLPDGSPTIIEQQPGDPEQRPL